MLYYYFYFCPYEKVSFIISLTISLHSNKGSATYAIAYRIYIL